MMQHEVIKLSLGYHVYEYTVESRIKNNLNP